MIQLIYYSKSKQKLTDRQLLDLLKTARVSNSQRGITGILLYQDRSFIQLLEGPREAVDDLFNAIKNDARHKDIRLLDRAVIQQRSFADWDMAFEKISDEDVSGIKGFKNIAPGQELPENISAEKTALIHMLMESLRREMQKIIVVVDDNRSNVNLLQKILQSDYSVITFDSGKSFLEWMQSDSHTPDLVILDRMMPAPSGDLICQQMKSDPNTRQIPVILCSALSSAEDIDTGLSFGADDYLTKPVDRGILLDSIKNLLL